jgi:magnesium transporter
MPQSYPSGYSVFASIMDQRVDLDADMIELMTKEISQYSKRVNQQEDINEDFLLDINQLQENTMIVRENIVDKQRLLSNLMKSDKYPPELRSRFGVILQDITSLINHTDFSFERLEYLQETVVGLINLDQNNIMKIFTLVSVLLMPPTLVASFYGMNVPLPFMDKPWSWAALLLMMFALVGAIFVVFKRKKML